MRDKYGRVLVGRRAGDIAIIPAIGILDMDRLFIFPRSKNFRFRLAFAWLEWRISIGLGRARNE